jgi:hypothetical protein
LFHIFGIYWTDKKQNCILQPLNAKFRRQTGSPRNVQANKRINMILIMRSLVSVLAKHARNPDEKGALFGVKFASS